MNPQRLPICVILLTGAMVYGILAASEGESVCPIECLCDLDQFLANCSGQGLLDAPQRGANESFIWVESMDLSENRLPMLRADTLANFAGLLELSLANNRIESVADGSFQNLEGRLYRLVLRGNQLTQIPAAIRALRVVRELDLSQNRLWSVGSGSFEGMTLLETLYLSENSLSIVDGAAFHGLQSLAKLSLTDNFLADDPVGWFADNPLKSLHLSNNAIPLVSEVRSWFGGNDHAPLQTLFLINNGIQSMAGKFQGMTNLHVLNLGANEIRVLDRECTEGLTNLNELIINANSLEYIGEGSFLKMPGLQVLTVDENNLKRLPKGLFSKTQRLTHLNLAHNYLDDISAVTDYHLSELRELYLFSNSIEEIGSHGFTRLTALTRLLAGGNRLSHLPNVTHLPWLETLELSHNSVRSVPHSAFQGTASIREIYLQQNLIEGLDYAPFAQLYSLERLSLAANPWFCDCRLMWMVDIVYADYPPMWVDDIIQGVFCANPPELNGYHVEEVSQDKLMVRCPSAPDRNVILTIVITWLGLILLYIGRYWFRKFSKSHKSKTLGRRNNKYQMKMSRKRRNGIMCNPSYTVTFEGSESYALISQNADTHEHDDGVAGIGNMIHTREEIARVTTV